MKVSKLTVKNIGIIADAEIEINKPQVVFYGDIKQGKSTLLNAVRWVCGGAFPADIIRHGQQDASVQLEGTEANGQPWVIRREWYTAKDGTAQARAITYTRNGVPVKKPVDAIKSHLNPYLLDQDYLRRMTTLERNRYLTDLFGVDTAEEDGAITEAERQASQLRIKVKLYGALDLTPVERVDVDKIKVARAGIIEQHAAKVRDAQAAIDRMTEAYNASRSDVDKKNTDARNSNTTRNGVIAKMDAAKERRKVLQAELETIENNLAKGDAWLDAHTAQVEQPPPESPDVSHYRAITATQPDTAACDQALQDAWAQNVRADNYAAAKVKAAAKAVDEKALLAQEKIGRDAKAAKIAKLASIGGATGITGLAFKEGGFDFDNTDSSMLSDSQLMRLSDALSAKYPDGFGLSMIDRGESLGKSVMTLWEDAQARQATVLVTVVGDKPAVIPENVGAYVVEAGKVTP